MSPKPHAKILSLDKTKAERMTGVKLIFGAEEIGEGNYICSKDNEVFARGEVNSQPNNKITQFYSIHACILRCSAKLILRYCFQFTSLPPVGSSGPV